MVFTSGLPSVIVPVLSRTMVSMCRAASRLSALRMRIPSLAPRPMPTMIAVGVARPRAHGQAIISTVTAAMSPCSSPPWGRRMSHNTQVMRAMKTMTGTKMRAMRSTSFWIGARLDCASCTRRMMRAMTVPRPTSVARYVRLPLPFIVPA